MTVTIPEAYRHLNIESGEHANEVDLFVDAANEWVASRIGQPGWISATAAAARPNIIKVATLFLISHLWESQRGPAASPLDGDLATTGGLLGFAIPNRVAELLQDSSTTATPKHSFPDAASWPDPVKYLAP